MFDPNSYMDSLGSPTITPSSGSGGFDPNTYMDSIPAPKVTTLQDLGKTAVTVGKTLLPVLLPMKAGTITTAIGQKTATHSGNEIDIVFDGGMDANVPSFTNGTVKKVVTGKTRAPGSFSYGNYAIVTDENGADHFYAHLDKVNVKEGDKIQMGQVIGGQGNSGDTRGQTGIHLHYEVRKDGKKVNAETYDEEYQKNAKPPENPLKYDLLAQGLNLAQGYLAKEGSKINNNDAPPPGYVLDSPQKLANYAMNVDATDLQNRKWWAENPNKQEAWKIIQNTQSIAKYGVPYSTISADTSPTNYNPFVEAVKGFIDPNSYIFKGTENEMAWRANQKQNMNIIGKTFEQRATNALTQNKGNPFLDNPIAKAVFGSVLQMGQGFKELSGGETGQEPINVVGGAKSLTFGALGLTSPGVARFNVIVNTPGVEPVAKEVFNAWEGLKGYVKNLPGVNLLPNDGKELLDLGMDILAFKKLHDVSKTLGSKASDAIQYKKIEYSPEEVRQVMSDITRGKDGSSPLRTEMEKLFKESKEGVDQKQVLRDAYKNGITVKQARDFTSWFNRFFQPLQENMPVKPQMSDDFVKLLTDGKKAADGKTSQVQFAYQARDVLLKNDTATLRNDMATRPVVIPPDQVDSYTQKAMELKSAQDQGKRLITEVKDGNEKLLSIETFKYSDGKTGVSINVDTSSNGISIPFGQGFETEKMAINYAKAKVNEFIEANKETGDPSIKTQLDTIGRAINGLEPTSGAYVGASNVRNVTFDQYEKLSEFTKSKDAQDFKTDIQKVAQDTGVKIETLNEAAGGWKDTDLQKVVFEPSTRVKLADDNIDAVRKFAATLGDRYNQQGMYIAKLNEAGKGYEYAIHFKDAKQGFELSKKLPEYGIEGFAFDLNNKTLYIGDGDGNLSSNVEKFYVENKEATKGQIEAQKADIEFIGQGEYQQIISSPRPSNEGAQAGRSVTGEQSQLQNPQGKQGDSSPANDQSTLKDLLNPNIKLEDLVMPDEAIKTVDEYVGDYATAIYKQDFTTSDGQRKLGAFIRGVNKIDNRIFVSNPKGTDMVHKTTPYHEIAHLYFREILDDKQRAQLLDQVKKEYGNLNDQQAEERLVQDFAEDVSGRKYTGYKAFIHKVMDFIRGLINKIRGLYQREDFARDVLNKKRPKGFKETKKGREIRKIQEAYQNENYLTVKFLKNKEMRDVLHYENVKNAIKGAELKQAEKDILSAIVERFKDKKTFTKAEFEQEIKKELLPLDVIKSKSWAEYGKENLNLFGGEAETHIYNSPFLHGETGHFRSEFEKTVYKDNVEIRQIPTTNQWAVLEKGVQLTPENMNQHILSVFSSKEKAQKWLDEKSVEGQTISATKSGLFGHTRVWDDGDVRYIAEIQSDSLQHGGKKLNKIDFYKSSIENYKKKLEENMGAKKLLEKRGQSSVTIEQSIELTQNRIDEYEVKLKEEEANLSSNYAQRFLDYKNIWHERLVREEIRLAALEGKKTVRFPTPYTLAKIEGYVAQDENIAPYTQPNGEPFTPDAFLMPGDEVEYGGDKYTVIRTFQDNGFEVAPSDSVYKINKNEWAQEQAQNRFDDLNYEYENILKEKGLNDGEITPEIAKGLEDQGNDIIDAIANKPDGKYSATDVEGDLIKKLKENELDNFDLGIAFESAYPVSYGGEDYMVTTEKNTEIFNQPDGYSEPVSKEEFSIGNFEDEQKSVLEFYDRRVNKYLQKIRKDLQVVTDDNGYDWYETAITEADKSEVEAFQSEEDLYSSLPTPKEIEKEADKNLTYQKPFQESQIKDSIVKEKQQSEASLQEPQSNSLTALSAQPNRKSQLSMPQIAEENLQKGGNVQNQSRPPEKFVDQGAYVSSNDSGNVLRQTSFVNASNYEPLPDGIPDTKTSRVFKPAKQSRKLSPRMAEALFNDKEQFSDLTVWDKSGLTTLSPTRAAESMDRKRFGIFKKEFLFPIQDSEKRFQIELKEKQEWIKDLFKGMTKQDKTAIFHVAEETATNEDNALIRKKPKIMEVARALRDEYDKLLDRINLERKAIGKDPIEKRRNYITHYQELSLAQDILTMIGWNMTEVPNSMLRISMYTKPGSPYFKFAKRRLGDLTDTDAERAISKYIEPALKVIHFSRAIKSARDILEYKVEKPSDYEGGKIDKVSLFNEKYPNAYGYFTEYLNVLTGKRDILDKVLQPIAEPAGALKKLFDPGSVGGNLGTAIKQLGSIRNTTAETGLFSIKGQLMINTPKGYRFYKNNSRIGLGRQYEPTTKGQRLLGSKLFAKVLDETSDKLSFIVGALDKEMVGGAFLSGYYKGKAIGLSEQDAIRYGDDVAERTQASANIVDRSPINRGKIKTVLGQFQTFVYNEWGQLKYDMAKKIIYGENSSQGYDTSGLGRIKEGRLTGLKRIAGFVIATILLAQIYEELGLPNPYKGEDSTIPFLQNEKANEVYSYFVNSIPFVSSVRFGGSPVTQGALNGIMFLFGNEEDRNSAKKKLSSLGVRLIPGGGQASKTIDAYSAIQNEGKVLSDNGEKVKFTIDIKDRWEIIKALAFGKYQTKAGQAYLENDPLAGLSDDARKQIEELRKQKQEEKTSDQQMIDQYVKEALNATDTKDIEKKFMDEFIASKGKAFSQSDRTKLKEGVLQIRNAKDLKSGDKNIDLLSGRNTDEQVIILKDIKKGMDDKEFKDYLMKLYQIGVIGRMSYAMALQK